MSYLLSIRLYITCGMLTNMYLSRTLCHEFLVLWRNREAWRVLLREFKPDTVKEFWDGEKVREYQAFWDPLLSRLGGSFCLYKRHANIFL